MLVCRACGKNLIPRKNTYNFYCNNQCQKDHAYSVYIENWLSGKEKGWKGQTRELSNYVRRWVRENLGEACQECAWNKKHPIDGRILTEIDHIDGNAENVTPQNLRVLCPNCHSMTPTFRARNKNSRRTRN